MCAVVSQETTYIYSLLKIKIGMKIGSIPLAKT